MNIGRLTSWLDALSGNGLRLRHRSLIVTWLPLLAATACVAWLWSWQTQIQELDIQGRRSVSALAADNDLIRDLLEAHNKLYGFALTGDRSSLVLIRRALGDAGPKLVTLRALSLDDRGQRRRLLEILRKAARIRNVQYALAQDRNEPRSHVVARLQKSGRSMDALIASVLFFRNIERQALRRRDGQLSKFWIVFRATMILSIFGLVGVILGTMALFQYGLVGRLRKLAETAHLVATGEDLGAPLPGSDEIADLDRDFRRMARAVRDRERELVRYELLSRHTRDAVLFINRTNGRLLDFNQAAPKLYGYPPEEFAELSVWDLRVPHEHDVVNRLPEDADERGTVYEATARRKDGSMFPVEGAVRTATLDAEQIVIAVVRDISERRRADEMRLARDKAVSASKFKSDFVAMMSHEIRTPINGVIGMAELLLRTRLDEEQHEYAAVISESAQSLLYIINDILDFSKIEAGKLQLEELAFDPAATVESIVGSLAPEAKKKGIRLETQLSSDFPPGVVGDPCRLKQVFWNLVGNAVKFTDAGSVTVAAEAERTSDDEVIARFTIRDTGVGISREAQKRLFEPFAQGDGSTTRRFGGTGLGLLIARRLVALMGGALKVMSEEGVGTVVSFVIAFKTAMPKKERVAEEAELAGIATVRGIAAMPHRVLLVEDNEINQRVVQRQLAVLGYNCALANDGRDGVARARSDHFDLILMDCNMPTMDGYAATRAIRALRKSINKAIPIVALTANAMEQDRQRCLDAGMNDYVSKPLSLESLRHILDRWLVPIKEEVACKPS